MKLIPVMTEKSMKITKDRAYTFWVPTALNKIQIKNLVGSVFGVTVTEVRTLNYKAGTKRNVRGKMQKIKARKKAIVILKEGNKIDLFEEEKKGKNAKAKKNTK